MKKHTILLCILVFLRLFPLFCTDLHPITSLAPTFSSSLSDVEGLVSEKDAVSHYGFYAKREPLISLGLSVTATHFDIVGIVDVHQSLVVLPDAEGYQWFQPQANLAIDNNAPRVGYVEFRYDGFLGSLGRRKLKWGPGTYDLMLSNTTPYYDGIWLQYRLDRDYGAFWYQFLATDFGTMYSSDAFPDTKTLFAHRVGFENRMFRATFCEVAMDWSNAFSVLSVVPFGVWQSGTHATSNVLLGLTGEVLLGPSRLYGSFVMNDSVVYGLEARDPSSLGSLLGFEWKLTQGSPAPRKAEYGLHENSFKSLQGGLTMGIECYYTSNYLYGSTEKAGTFTAPLKQFAYGGSLYGDSIAYYLGFPYGPGALLIQNLVSYETSSFAISGMAGLLLKNDASAATLYADSTMDTFALGNPDYHILFSVEGRYVFNSTWQIQALLEEDWNVSAAESNFYISLGATIQIFS